MDLHVLQSIRDRLGNQVASLEEERAYLKGQIQYYYRLADPQDPEQGTYNFNTLNVYRDAFRDIESQRVTIGRGIKAIKQMMRALSLARSHVDMRNGNV